ncbi:MAG: hypothetical protein H6815_04260 [Phycisphaeraceae bacterium]|nr:hypothetical protein [Phycisphaerales bacterium]MCB9859645.1 hypothetical protein [Phycisphaeraceae bacterium]
MKQISAITLVFTCGLAFCAPSYAQQLDGTVVVDPHAGSATYTLQLNGPRQGIGGDQFFNIEGTNNGNFYGYGVLRFDAASNLWYYANDLYGVNNWYVDSVTLNLTQSNAAFTADGGMHIYFSSDGTTDIKTPNSPLTVPFFNPGAQIPVGNGGSPICQYNFTQVANGHVDTYDQSGGPNGASEAMQLIPEMVQALQNGDVFSLVFVDNSPDVAATYRGQWASPTEASPELAITVKPLNSLYCYPDCDRSGSLNIFDYICFGNAYAAQDAYADCDGSGSFNIFDYICFGNAYAAGCAGPITFPQGVNLQHTAGAQIQLPPIPPDFFGPGSEPIPVLPPLCFVGDPIGTSGAFELGNTDTIIRRNHELSLPDVDSATPVEIELVELNLVSCQPIQVNVNGQPTQWDVHVALNPDIPLEPGTMVFHRDAPTNGGFDFQLPIQPFFVFTQVQGTGEAAMPGPVVNLQGGGQWEQPSIVTPSPIYFGPQTNTGPRIMFMTGQTPASAPLQLHFDWDFIAPRLPDPPPLIDPSAIVDPSAHIARGANIGPNTFVGPNAVIGPFASLQQGAQVQQDAVLGANSHLGQGTTLHPGAIVDSDCQIGNGVQIRPNTIIGQSSIVQDGVQIGQNSFFWGNAQIGALTTIGANVVAERFLTTGQGTVIASDLYLAENASTPAGSSVVNDLFRCYTQYNNLNVFQTLTFFDCELQDGWVAGNVKVNGPVNNKKKGKNPKSGEQMDPNNLPNTLANLQDDVNTAGGGGTQPPIKDREYKKDTYDCDDFADDMEQELENNGYKATFTCVWLIGERTYWSWSQLDYVTERIPIWGHAISDVHLNGRLVFIEPQTGRIGLGWLDHDGDGVIEYTTNHNNLWAPTDGELRIEVYESRAAAEAAGVIMD